MKTPQQQVKLSLILTVASCLVSLQPSLATDVSGTIVNDTWIKANSPYNVVGDVLVAGLTIQPGVVINFRSNYNFEVAGVIAAIGTSSDPIIFRGTNGWQGIYFNYSSPGSEMAYCVVSNSVNSGIRVIQSTPLIRDSVIANNSTTGHGGGIYAIEGTNTLTLRNCMVAANVANRTQANGTYVGGGIYVSGNSLITGCTVRDNVCYATAGYSQDQSSEGGGLYSDTGRCVVRNTAFVNNQAASWNTGSWATSRAYGGGVCIGNGSLWVTNSILSSNVTSANNVSTGGGLYLMAAATGNVVNCTFAYNNTERLVSENAGIPVINSILYFNAGGGTQLSGPTSVTFCDVQGGLSGVGNINFNPIFLSTTNLIIVSNSPCMNAGSAFAAFNDTCFPPSLGTSRNDIGAHGGPGACSWTGPFTNPRNPALTNVSGTIVNETWTKANSPYNVVGDVLVAGLTIQPGVVINFRSNYNFEVAGVIAAIGTSSDPIIFRGTNGWQGIYFNYSSPGSEMAYCVVSNSVNSGIRVIQSTPLIRDSVIANNSTTGHGGGIYAIEGTNTLTLRNCMVAANVANRTQANGTHKH